MNVYFDKANFVSYIHSVNKANFEECNIMLKNKCNLFFNFNKEDIEEIEEDDDYISMWMSQNADGFNSSLEWNANFPVRPLKSKLYKQLNKEQLSSVYLLDDDDIDKIINLGVLLIAKHGDEIKVLSNLFFKDLQYTRNIFREVNSWEDINNYSSPCSDIIIYDKYLFSDKNIYDANIYSIIRNLCKKADKAIINIVIFTLSSAFRETPGAKSNYKDIFYRINNIINDCVGIKPRITIVTGCSDTLGEHDRTILTNYKMFSSGDTFNYFNSSGAKITKGRFLHVYSLADGDNRKDAADFIKKMQDIYDHVNLINKDLIYKDKNSKSNFLDIN